LPNNRTRNAAKMPKQVVVNGKQSMSEINFGYKNPPPYPQNLDKNIAFRDKAGGFFEEL